MFKCISQYRFGLIQDILKFLPEEETSIFVSSHDLYEASIPYLVQENHLKTFELRLREKLLIDRTFSETQQQINANKDLLNFTNIILHNKNFENNILKTSIEILQKGLELRLKKISLESLQYLAQVINTPFELDAFVALFPLILDRHNFYFNEVLFTICGKPITPVENLYPSQYILSRADSKFRWHILNVISSNFKKNICRQGLKISFFDEFTNRNILCHTVTIPFSSNTQNHNLYDIALLIKGYREDKTQSNIERLEYLSINNKYLFNEIDVAEMQNLLEVNYKNITMIFNILKNLSAEFYNAEVFIQDELNTLKRLESNLDYLPYVLDFYSITDLVMIKDNAESLIDTLLQNNLNYSSYHLFIIYQIAALGRILSNLTSKKALKSQWSIHGMEMFFCAIELGYIEDTNIINQYVLNTSFLLEKIHLNKIINNFEEHYHQALFNLINCGFSPIKNYLNNEFLSTLLTKLKSPKSQQILQLLIRKHSNIFDEAFLTHFIKKTEVVPELSVFNMLVSLIKNRSDLVTDNIKTGLKSLLDSSNIKIIGFAIHLFGQLIKDDLIEHALVTNKVLFLSTSRNNWIKEEIIEFIRIYLDKNLAFLPNNDNAYIRLLISFTASETNRVQLTALRAIIKLTQKDSTFCVSYPGLIDLVKDKLKNVSAEYLLAEAAYVDSPFLEIFPEKIHFKDLNTKYIGFFKTNDNQTRTLETDEIYEVNSQNSGFIKV